MDATNSINDMEIDGSSSTIVETQATPDDAEGNNLGAQLPSATLSSGICNQITPQSLSPSVELSALTANEQLVPATPTE